MKDARGHGSDGRGGSPPVRGFQDKYIGTGPTPRDVLAGSQRLSDIDAARALASGPKSAPAPVHDAMSNIYGSGGGGPRPVRYGGGTQAWHSFGR
jgi:hypothetical protein